MVYRRRRGARAASAGRRVPRRARWPSSTCAPTPSTRRSARIAAGRSRRCTSAAGRRRCCRPTVDRAPHRARARRGSGSPTDAEVTLEANPGPDERGDRWRCARAGVTRLSFGAQSLDDARAAPARAAAPAPRRRRRRRRGPRGRDPLGQPRPPVRRPRRDARELDGDARRGARARPRPPVAVRADPRRPRRRGADRPDRRPPADDRRARAAGARSRPARARTRTAPRPSTTTPSCAWPRPASAATRSATGRGRATRAGTTWPTGSAGRTRRSGPGAHAFDGATRRWNAARLDGYVGALTRPTGRRPRCRPVARRPSDATAAAAEAVILGLRLDTGVPLAAAQRAAARRRLRLGARRRAARRHRRRPGRADDPRPPALERAVRPPRLT